MRLLLLAILVMYAPCSVVAHEDANQVIKGLSRKIATRPTADLYYRRAVEYRSVREIDHAIEDCRTALKQRPDHTQALRLLAELLSQQEKHDEALEVGQELLLLSPTPLTNLLLADLAFAAGEKEKALHHVKLAPPNDIHACLLHAHLTPDGGEAVDILKKGEIRTRSIVLRNAWLDALVSAGRYEKALPIIEGELKSSRFRASWWIKRARIHLQTKDQPSANQDLEFALVEIEKRLSPSRPDLTLINDRGVARALIGQKEKAAQDLKRLRASTFSPLSYSLLSRLLDE